VTHDTPSVRLLISPGIKKVLDKVWYNSHKKGTTMKKLFGMLLLTALTAWAPPAAWAAPCDGMSTDEAVSKLAPKNVSKIEQLNQADLTAIRDYLSEKYPGSGGPLAFSTSAFFVEFIDGSVMAAEFDKDDKFCAGTIISKTLYNELMSVVVKSRVTF
jgi:hypothetical protein